MHIFDLERRFMGGYGIVGGNLPLAAGLALASDYRGDRRGHRLHVRRRRLEHRQLRRDDEPGGALELPVVFLVENNLYGMGTSIERHSAVTDLSHKAEGLGVPGVRVDGMDVLAVRETVAEHIRMAREDRQPTLVEAFTYRYRGHSAADPEVYRDEGGGRGVAREGPDQDLRATACSRRGCSPRTSSRRCATRPSRLVTEAVEFADNSPEPPLDSLYDHLYVVGDQVPGWYAVDERTPELAPRRGGARGGRDGEARQLAEARRGLRRAGRAELRRRPSGDRDRTRERSRPEDVAADGR